MSLNRLEPPEPIECCDQWEDPDHDSQDCLDFQAEVNAERQMEMMREEQIMEGHW